MSITVKNLCYTYAKNDTFEKNAVKNVSFHINEGEYIEFTVTSPAKAGELDAKVQTFKAGYGENYSKFSFAVTTPGIHEIRAIKKSSDGNVISEYVTYKALSYSKEYNIFDDEELALELCKNLASSGGGDMIDDPYQVFANSAKFIHRVIDPRTLFMILAISLFLLGIAARKFKWKWPGEIIRDKKVTKSMSKN